MSAKLDLYKLHKADYVTPSKPVLIEIKPAQYLTIEGKGEPGGQRFSDCLGALYGVAYTIKMTRKSENKGDYSVCKLESQWFFDGDPAELPKCDWKWKMMIRTPDAVSPKDLERAVATLLKRGKAREANEVKLERIEEGRCVQMLHVGPYDKEGATIALMNAFAESKGLRLTTPHHEIYLSDPRRVPPDRLKTILREPVVPGVA